MRLIPTPRVHSVMAPALKVYRTPIGFHDAYVAAPSQKAALEAWGADANLFSRGAAERVTDPALTAEPLAQPGKVIRRPRASAAEHFAALAQTREKPSPKQAGAIPDRTSRAKTPPKPKPRPSRAALDAAERALAEQQQQAEADLAVLEQQRARIAKEIAQLRVEQRKEAARLERRVKRARETHEAALARWRAS